MDRSRARRLLRALLATVVATVGLQVVPRPVLAEVPHVVISDRRPTPSRAPLPVPAEAVAAAHGELAPTDTRVTASESGLDPFSLIGVSLDVAPDEPVLLRTSRGGAWTDWLEVEFGDEAPDDAAEANPGAHSAPIWVGDADAYEVLVGAAATPAVHLGREETRLEVVLEQPSVAGGVPNIVPRSYWGARAPTRTPQEASTLDLAFVHHSVSTNNYSASDVPAMLRGIQAYHMDANGWSDIGYNFAVDRFGRTWEAHAGGTIRAIIGGHARGFNTRSVGVVLLGNHSEVAPTSAAVSAVADLIGWRFAAANVDPRGSITYTTTGSTKYAAGTAVTLNRISSHRDVSATACPGSLISSTVMSSIRSQAVSRFMAYHGNVATRWLTSPTRRYHDLAGGALGAPDVAGTARGRLEVVVRGGDNRLWRRAWTGQYFTPFTPVNGSLGSAPAIAGHEDGSSDVVARATNGQLLWGHRAPDGRWSGWTSLGGNITTAPDIASTPSGNLIVVARGGDGAVWSRTRAPGGPWFAWGSWGGSTPSGSAPAVVGLSDLEIAIGVRGGDNALWMRHWRLGLWTPWLHIGGIITSGPALASSGPGTIDAAVRGGDGRLYWSRRGLAGWSGWGRISREPVAQNAGFGSWGTGRLDLVANTLDGRPFQTYWTPTAGW